MNYSALCNLAASSTLSAAVFSLLLVSLLMNNNSTVKFRSIQIQNGLAEFAVECNKCATTAKRWGSVLCGLCKGLFNNYIWPSVLHTFFAMRQLNPAWPITVVYMKVACSTNKCIFLLRMHKHSLFFSLLRSICVISQINSLPHLNVM